MKSGKYVEAIKELGKGLHAIQDKITHTHGKNGTSKRVFASYPYTELRGFVQYKTTKKVYFYWHGLGSGPDSYKEPNPNTGYKGCEKYRKAYSVTWGALLHYAMIYKKKFG